MTGQLPPGWTVTPPPGTPAPSALPPGWTVTPPTPEQEFRNGPVGFADNIGRRLASGATFGFADEIAAGLDALTHPLIGRGSSAPTIGERYDANLRGERGIDKAFEKKAPFTAGAADVGGLVAGSLAAPMMLPGKVAAMIPAPTSMLGKMALGGTAGGVTGGVYGFGTGEGSFTDRAENAGTNAAIGGVTGALIPPVIAGASRLAAPVLDKMGLRNADKGALNQVMRAFERDGIAPDEAMAKLKAWQAAGSKPEALVDLGGENVKALASTAANLPGKSRQAAMDLVEARKSGAPDRVGADVARSISPSTNYAGTVDELMASRRRVAQPLYDKAYQQPAYWDPTLDTLMKRPSMKEAWSKAQRLAAEEGIDLPKVWKLDEKTGDLIRTGESRPDWQAWDYIKRGLDSVIEGNRDQFGKMTDVGRTVTSTKSELLGILDRVNPDYKAARAAYAGPSQSIDAMKLGRSILSEDADITAKKIAALDPGDKEFFRAGVAKALQDKVENTVDGRNVVASFFNKPSLRNKLAAAFDSPAEFSRFEALMKREMDMAATNNMITPRGGSPTFRHGANAEDMKIDPVAGPIANLLNLQFGTAAKQAASTLLRPSNQGMNSSTADALAPLLFQKTPEEAERVLRGLLAARGAHQSVGSARAQLLPGLLGGVSNAPMGLLGPYRRQ